ncbi:MAG TPA: exodeoxyribonuclease VII large subunit [Dehalococcoidia bacterium]|nr:exodeoxyribonuclease VII large subunit [Dehalococcoidia bacterium]
MLALTVQQVVGYLKELIESNATLGDLWISGEISNLSRSAAGHIYFTLKDEAAQMRCAFFKRANAGMKLEHGDAVLAHGYVSVYEQRGELNFVVDFVHPQGAGVLNAQFERLRQALEAEGLFDEARKRPLPPFPRRIGVVTSPTGAVLHDIITVVGRRWPLAEIVLAPTAVQGEAAAPGIVSALADLNERGDVDVIIVARGGGSQEDLWPFNDERVPRAIYASRVPVVSAVGHETDFTLADFAADLRAPTPSVAGELVVPDQIELAMRVGGYVGALESWARQALDDRRDALDRLVDALEDVQPDICAARERLDRLLAGCEERLRRAIERSLALVEARELQLGSLSPLAVLGRGYAVVQRVDGGIVTHVRDAGAGDLVSIRVQDGALAAEVKQGGQIR